MVFNTYGDRNRFLNKTVTVRDKTLNFDHPNPAFNKKKETLVRIYNYPIDGAENDLEAVLKQYGKHKSKILVVEDNHALATGERAIYIEIEKNIPSYLCVGKHQVRIRYANQQQTCRKCYQTGHIARDCNEGATCRECGAKDHVRKDCPKKICFHAAKWDILSRNATITHEAYRISMPGMHHETWIPEHIPLSLNPSDFPSLQEAHDKDQSTPKTNHSSKDGQMADPPQRQMETEDSTELVTTEIAQHSPDTILMETASKSKKSIGDTTEPTTKENTTTDDSGTSRTPPRDTEPTNDPGKETTPEDEDTEKQQYINPPTKTRTDESPQTEHREQDSTDSDSTITGSDNEEEYHQNELLTLRTESSKRDLRHSPQRIKKEPGESPLLRLGAAGCLNYHHNTQHDDQP